jgi:hypothetical protein
MSIISSNPRRRRAKAQAATLAAILGLLGGGQALTPASAAAEPNMGTPGVCKPEQVWDFYGQQCMATEEILVSGGSGVTPPHDPGPRSLGPGVSGPVGSDAESGPGSGPRGGGARSSGVREAPSMGPAPKRRPYPDWKDQKG